MRVSFPSENRLTWQGQRSNTCPMDSTVNLTSGVFNDPSSVEGVPGAVSNLRGVRFCGLQTVIGADGKSRTGFVYECIKTKRARFADELSDDEWLAYLHEEADRSVGSGYCYFVGAAAVGMVKIGYASNVKNRFSHIQVNSPVDLELLAVAEGGMARESAYHFQFDAARGRGEWFRLTPEIEAEIERLT